MRGERQSSANSNGLKTIIERNELLIITWAQDCRDCDRNVWKTNGIGSASSGKRTQKDDVKNLHGGSSEGEPLVRR